jgi:hypothetical protein
MRDAIVLSGWNWDASNVPERMALAIACAGGRVLYCENPVSVFRNTARPLTEVHGGVFALGLKFLGHRLNSLPVLLRIQTELLSRQILEYARKLNLTNPLFVYPHGHHCLALARGFQRRGFRLIHLCMDYELDLMMEHVSLSDLTLAIPLLAYEELKQKFGEKIKLLPQFSALDGSDFPARLSPESPALSGISRPRLAYLGDMARRTSIPLLQEVLSRHPEWQFLSFESRKWLPLPNEHVLPWRTQKELSTITAGLDAGFMPYDCSVPKNLHCVPLKLFDYFACGLPVASTPISCLSEYEDLVYVGATAEQLADAVSLAVNEPADSPKRAKRKAIAEKHSIVNVSRILEELIGRESEQNPHPGTDALNDHAWN